MVERLRAQYESGASLDNIPESPISCPPNKELAHHINGMSNDTNTNTSTKSPTKSPTSPKVPPPVPPKYKRNSKEESSSSSPASTPLINQLELENKELKDKLEEKDKELEALRQQAREAKKREKRLQHKNDRYDNTIKARRAQESLKKWSSTQPSVTDLHKVITLEDLRDPQELIQQFVESERIYLNVLEAIHHFFYQPIQTMAVFKKDIVSTQQFQAIFLNSPQILTLHRLFYVQLCHLRFLPKDARIEEFLVILERTVPSFSLYSGFQSDFFMQNLQRELSQWHSKPQISMLLSHLEKKTEGKTLAELMRIPAERLSEYTNLLKPFMDDKIKGTRYVNDSVIKRVSGLYSFITSLQVELLDEKGEWECIAEKNKVICKSSPDSPIPLEMFNPDTRLVKQGPIIVTEKGKEIQKICFLFTTHLALADKSQNHHIIFPENAMISLVGATLHANVDMGGQVIQPDIKSGLEQDMLGFRINFVHEHLTLKVGRPNEKKQWLDSIEKTLEKISKSEVDSDMEFIIPDESPKIAAASLEKLFQHLTNPQIADRDDFIEVFLNTYPSFTTPKNVLTALFNCIHCPKEKTPDPTTSSTQVVPNHVFTFNMDDNMDTVSISTSLTSMSANSQNYDSSGSDSDYIDSPDTPRKVIPPPHPNEITTPTNEKKPHPIDNVITRTSVSTDSDSSPYTSGVPVAMDTKREAQNGWQDPEQSLLQTPPISHTPNDDPAYVTFHRPFSRESGSYGDTEDDDFYSLSQSSQNYTASLSLPDSHEQENMFSEVDHRVRQIRQTTTSLDDIITEQQPPSCRTSLVSPLNSQAGNYSLRVETMNVELDNAQKVVNDVLFNLQEPSPPRGGPLDDVYNRQEDEANFKCYNSRPRNMSMNTSSQRLSESSTLSFSEPDLALTAVNSKNTLCTMPGAIRNRSEDRSAEAAVEDELLSSLPATVARKFADPSPTHLMMPSPKKSSRFSLGFVKGGSSGKKERLDKPRKSITGSSSKQQLSVSNSLYFGSPEPQRKSLTSPARAGIGNLFKKKDKGKINKSLSINFTDGHTPETPSRKSSRVRRNTSLGSQNKRPNRYMNFDEITTSPRRDRTEDGSPRSTRKGTVKNYTLAAKIFAVLNKWIELHFEDFTDPELIDLLDDFLKTSVASDSAESALATETFDLLNYYRSTYITFNPSFGNLLARVTTLDITMLEDIDWERPAKLIVNKEIDLSKTSRDPAVLKTISEQITLILFAHYNAILRSELLNCNWKKKDKEKLAANINRMIKQTNEMTSWICTEVLKRDTFQARAFVLESFIYIAWYCYKHNDMHSALTITVALSSSCIKRLSKSWDAIERKARQKYEKLKDATDHHEKCKKLRERLEDVTQTAIEKTGELPAALPYIGAYLEQIYVLDIGLQTYNSDGLVNFVKMTKLSALIDTTLQYQRSPYEFAPKLDIIAYITSANQLSDNELYDLSVTKEPSKR